MDGTFPGCVDDRIVIRLKDNMVFTGEIANAAELMSVHVSQVFYRVYLSFVLLDDTVHCKKLQVSE